MAQRPAAEMLVPFLRKIFSGIFSAAQIRQQEILSVYIEETAHIIVVVGLSVVPALCRHAGSVRAPADDPLGIRQHGFACGGFLSVCFFPCILLPACFPFGISLSSIRLFLSPDSLASQEIDILLCPGQVAVQPHPAVAVVSIKAGGPFHGRDLGLGIFHGQIAGEAHAESLIGRPVREAYRPAAGEITLCLERRYPGQLLTAEQIPSSFRKFIQLSGESGKIGHTIGKVAQALQAGAVLRKAFQIVCFQGMADSLQNGCQLFRPVFEHVHGGASHAAAADGAPVAGAVFPMGVGRP